MRHLLLPSLLLFLIGFVTIEAMRKQGVAVRGKFLCGRVPAASNSTRVRITDIDTGEFV
jgi:hypothetical protein